MKPNRDSNNNNEVLIQKRSSSSCVHIKRRKGDRFWKIGRFFTTKRSNSKIKGLYAALEDGTYSGARSFVSGARISISAARSSGFKGMAFDQDRKSGYSKSEPRKSGFDSRESLFGLLPNRRVFSLREGNFTTVHDSVFIDLKFDLDSKLPPPSAAAMTGEFSPDRRNSGWEMEVSCRIAVNDRGIKMQCM
ncbi:hypothetical protein LINPERPRIM_LOCUS35693 [Linum perenne]